MMYPGPMYPGPRSHAHKSCTVRDPGQVYVIVVVLMCLQIRLFYYPYGYNIGSFKIALVRENPVNPVKPRVLFQDMPFANTLHGKTTWIRLTLPITDVYHK